MNRSRTTAVVVIAAALAAACSRPDDLPDMAVTQPAVTFEAAGPSGDPSAAVVRAVNTGGGSLAPPTAAIEYLYGTGWLEVVVSGDAAPYSVVLQPRTAALQPGTYRAGVRLTSASPSARTANVEVTLTVPGPSYAVSTTSLSFQAPRTGDPAPVALAVTNDGRGTLPTPDVEIAYEGASGGWLTAAVTSAANGYAVAVQAREVTGMASGFHAAKLSIGSPYAGRKTVDVSFLLAPELVVSASLAPFVPARTDPPLTQTFTVRNTGRGVLPPPSVVVTGATSLVSASVTGSGAPYTVVVTADGWRRVGAGDYPAKVAVASPGMATPPPEVDAVVRVGPAVMRVSGEAPWTAYQGCPLPGAQVLTVENVGVGYLTRPTVTLPADAAAWLDAEVIGSRAPYRVVLTPKAAPVVAAGATFSTAVTLSDSLAGRPAAPVQVPVSFALRANAITGTQATPSPMVIHAQAGTGDPEPAVLSLRTAGGCIPAPSLTYAYGPGEPAWLSYKVATAAQRHDVTLRASTAGMAAGAVFHLALNVSSFASGSNTPLFATAVPLTLENAKIEPAGALTTSRRDPAAVALPDGRVLVTGGLWVPGTVPAYEVLASAEVYDPASGRSEPFPPLLQARSEHRAVALDDGRVVVCGGQFAGGRLQTCEVTSGGAWTILATLHGAVVSPSLVQAGDKLIVAGSVGYFPQQDEDVEVIDLTTGEVTIASASGAQRVRGAAAVALADGTVLVAGTADGSCWRYDPASDVWSRTGSGVSARTGPGGFGEAPALVALRDGRVLAVKGNSAELWDPSTGAWSPAGFSTYSHGSGALVALGNGKVVALNGQQTLDYATGEVELFDPATTTWSIVKGVSVPSPALRAPVVRLADGRLVVLGGRTPTGHSVAEVFTW